MSDGALDPLLVDTQNLELRAIFAGPNGYAGLIGYIDSAADDLSRTVFGADGALGRIQIAIAIYREVKAAEGG